MHFGTTPFSATNIFPHSHTSWEILCYIEGSGTLYVGEQAIPFCPGMIVCQPPDIPHREVSEAGFRNLFFHDPSFFPPDRDGVSILRDNSDHDFEQLMRLGLKNFNSSRPESGRILQSTVEILYQLLALWMNTPNADFVDELEAAILAGYTDPAFRLSDAVKDINYCADHIRRSFAARKGKTPLEYLTELRIERARTLLEGRGSCDLSIKAIGELSGFDNAYYFSQVYKKVTGESPTQTRARGEGAKRA